MSITANIRSVPLLNRYEINEISGCWLWLGLTSDDDYARAGKRNAHRLFYEAHVAPIPEGHDVDHLCKRRNCVNPAHLEAVTEAENNQRKSRTVTLSGKHFDLCRNGHLITGKNIRIVRRGGKEYQRCYVCTNYNQGATPRKRTREAIADATRDVDALPYAKEGAD